MVERVVFSNMAEHELDNVIFMKAFEDLWSNKTFSECHKQTHFLISASTQSLLRACDAK